MGWQRRLSTYRLLACSWLGTKTIGRIQCRRKPFSLSRRWRRFISLKKLFQKKKESITKRSLRQFLQGQKGTKSANLGKNSTLRGSKLVALHWTPLPGEQLGNSARRGNGCYRRCGDASKPCSDFIVRLISRLAPVDG